MPKTFTLEFTARLAVTKEVEDFADVLIAAEEIAKAIKKVIENKVDDYEYYAQFGEPTVGHSIDCSGGAHFSQKSKGARG